MWISIVYGIVFLATIVGIVLFPRKDDKLHIVQVIPAVVTGLLCYQVYMEMVLQKLGCKVDLRSAIIPLLFLNLLIWIYIIKMHQIQEYVVSKAEIITICGLILFVILEAHHMFGFELRLVYLNDDPNAVFRNSMSMFRKENVSGFFFCEYIAMLLYNFFNPFIPAMYYYKVFIVFDISLQILQIWMFYAVAAKISRNRLHQGTLFVLTFFYYLGYPTFSFMRGNFMYWSTGILLLLLMCYYLQDIIGFKERNIIIYLELMNALLGNIFSNKLYVITNTIIVIGCLLLSLGKKKRFIAVVGTVLCGSIAILLIGHQYYDQVVNTISYNGFSYGAPYSDFLPFVPIVLYGLILYIRKKRRKEWTLYALLIASFLWGGMLILYLDNISSTYYYYKIYYTLWVILWILTVTLYGNLQLAKRKIMLLYLVVLLTVGIGQYRRDCDAEMISKNDLMNIYRYNMQWFTEDYESDVLECEGRYLKDTTLEKLQKISIAFPEAVFYCSEDEYMMGRWYSAIFGKITFCGFGRRDQPAYQEEYNMLMTQYNYYEILMDKESNTYRLISDLISESEIAYDDGKFVVIKRNKE